MFASSPSEVDTTCFPDSLVTVIGHGTNLGQEDVRGILVGWGLCFSYKRERTQLATRFFLLSCLVGRLQNASLANSVTRYGAWYLAISAVFENSLKKCFSTYGLNPSIKDTWVGIAG